ncbi:MAG: D-tyrosyl-tRNA(Tyr) deacylase [Oscillospiraceae bacterium]|jgi:D-tyrosyl-tRNA(Tyr) deacylase|nr:D-tyrosyl-tRNA(Tyr) deacylase [Oscillospiraceae bacterium]
MRAVIQRVTASSVSVDGVVVGAIGVGLNIFLCAMQGDTERHAQILAEKITKLRIFADENGKMNRSVSDIGGAILLISQFTLAADIRKGNRPSFAAAADPQRANALYERFADLFRKMGVSQVETGVFGADMHVEIQNDGPVTIILDTCDWPVGER